MSEHWIDEQQRSINRENAQRARDGRRDWDDEEKPMATLIINDCLHDWRETGATLRLYEDSVGIEVKCAKCNEYGERRGKMIWATGKVRVRIERQA